MTPHLGGAGARHAPTPKCKKQFPRRRERGMQASWLRPGHAPLHLGLDIGPRGGEPDGSEVLVAFLQGSRRDAHRVRARLRNRHHGMIPNWTAVVAWHARLPFNPRRARTSGSVILRQSPLIV